MTRQLLICIAIFVGAGNSAFGGLKIYVNEKGSTTHVVSAKVTISQKLFDGQRAKPIDEGTTQRDGGPYEPKIELPNASLVITARKDGKYGFKEVVFNGGGKSPIEIIVEIDESGLAYLFPPHCGYGYYLVLQRVIRPVAETRTRYCVDAEGKSHPVTYTCCRYVSELVWVPLSFASCCVDPCPPDPCCPNPNCKPVRCCPVGPSWTSVVVNDRTPDVMDGGDSGDSDTARLSISVPEDAVVFLNGRRTTKTGTRRDYYSVGLKYGRSYKYVVRAQVVRDGKVIEDVREVLLRGGDSKNLAFDLSGQGNSQLTKAR